MVVPKGHGVQNYSATALIKQNAKVSSAKSNSASQHCDSELFRLEQGILFPTERIENPNPRF